MRAEFREGRGTSGARWGWAWTEKFPQGVESRAWAQDGKDSQAQEERMYVIMRPGLRCGFRAAGVCAGRHWPVCFGQGSLCVDWRTNIGAEVV